MATGERPAWWPPRVGSHALQRYREQYPEATTRDVLWDTAHGRDVSPELVAALTCAPSRAKGTARFVAGRERRGVYVLEPSIENAELYAWTIVTYLRFSESQRAFLEG